MKSESCALIKLLSMFPYTKCVHIRDIKNGVTLHYGKICDLDTNGKINNIKPDRFVMDSFDVINDWFIINGHYELGNNEC